MFLILRLLLYEDRILFILSFMHCTDFVLRPCTEELPSSIVDSSARLGPFARAFFDQSDFGSPNTHGSVLFSRMTMPRHRVEDK